jgi:hypothetical protein
VIAGHDTLASENIARLILNRNIDAVKAWAEERNEDRILEVWIQTDASSTSAELVRTYMASVPSQARFTDQPYGAWPSRRRGTWRD